MSRAFSKKPVPTARIFRVGAMRVIFPWGRGGGRGGLLRARIFSGGLSGSIPLSLSLS